MTFPFRVPPRFVPALLLVSWVAHGAAFEPPCYEGRRLAAGTNTFSRSGAISDAGVALGIVVYPGRKPESGVAWFPGEYGELPRHFLNPYGAFAPESINAQGDVAGYVYDPDQAEFYPHAAVYSRADRHYHRLDNQLPAGAYSQALGGNDAGYVVGAYYEQDFEVATPFIWSSTLGRRNLPYLRHDIPRTLATAINNAGLVVGHGSVTFSTDYHVFTWTQADGLEDISALLPGAPDTLSGGLNQRGQVLVYAYYEDVGYVWDTATRTMTALPGLGQGTAGLSGINDDGVIVGTTLCNDGGANGLCATAWYPTENGWRAYDLNTLTTWRKGKTPPTPIYVAMGINSQGQITADAPYGSNYEDSYVLTPRKRIHGECPDRDAQ